MGNRALAGMSGAAKGFERGINNMFEIMQAKDRLKMEREKFDINKQQSKLNLKKLSYELDPERLAQAETLEKDKIKLGETKLKIQQQTLDAAESENKREVEKDRREVEIQQAMLQRMFPGGLKGDQGGPLAPGTSITQGGITIKGPKQGDGRASKATQEALKGLSGQINRGEITTSKDALDALDSKDDMLRLQGVDVDYIRGQVEKILPEDKVDARGADWFGREAEPEYRKKGGRWYARGERDGRRGWVLAPADKAKSLDSRRR